MKTLKTALLIAALTSACLASKAGASSTRALDKGFASGFDSGSDLRHALVASALTDDRNSFRHRLDSTPLLVGPGHKRATKNDPTPWPAYLDEPTSAKAPAGETTSADKDHPLSLRLDYSLGQNAGGAKNAANEDAPETASIANLKRAERIAPLARAKSEADEDFVPAWPARSFARLETESKLSTSMQVDASFALAGPIPEPETYAMLLAGLGLLTAISRRRKSA